MFKGSGVLRLIADDSGPQGGSILGAVNAQRSELCAFFCVVFSHNGLLEGQI